MVSDDGPSSTPDESRNLATTESPSTSVLSTLYDPDAYFRERAPGLSLAGAVIVALAAAVLTTTVFGVGMWLVTQNVTGTVPVDNPERPPDTFCSGDPPDNLADRCDAPETVDRRVGAILWDAFSELLPFLFLGVLIVWPLYGVGLHVAAVLAGGDGSIRDSVAIAAWGLIPTAVSMVGVVAVLWTVLVGRDFSASAPAGLEAEFDDVLATLSGTEYTAALVAIGIGVTAWQAYVWGYGLDHAHDLPTRRALATAGAFAVVAYVVGLAL